MSSRRLDLVWVVALSAGVFAVAHLSAWSSDYVVNDDVRQQLFWMERWSDPDLFPGDRLADYASHYVPWGVQALYWLASAFASPIGVSKALPGLLFVGLGVCLYLLGKSTAGRRAAWATVALLWLNPFFLDRLAGGLARGFAAPLLALGWWAWSSNRPRLVGAVLLAQALFIPYVAVLFGAALSLAWLTSLRWPQAAPPFPRGARHLAVLALAAASVCLFSASMNAAGHGPLVSGRELDAPELGPLGRFRLVPFASPVFELLVEPWLRLAPFREVGFLSGLITVAAAALLLGLGTRLLLRSRRPTTVGPGLWLGAASLLLYVAARLLLARLFLPSRYLEYSVQLLLAVALGAAPALVLSRLRPGWATALLLAAAVLGAVRLQGVGLRDYSGEAVLLARLSREPRDVVVAGHPYTLDNVPTFARRRVVASFELAHPWNRGHWQWIAPRLEALLDAYYTADPDRVREVSERYGVSLWVVDERQFEPTFIHAPSPLVPLCEALRLPPGLEPFCETLASSHRAYDASRLPPGASGPAPFFEPFGERIRRRVRGRTDFALLESFPSESVSDHLRLVDVRAELNAPRGTGPGR